MTIAHPGSNALSYRPCRYRGSRLLFRGPENDLSRPYAAFFGGTETYGRFIGSPFPELVAERLGISCVNLGCVNGGVDVYLNDGTVLDIAAKAQVTVIQVMGAHNLSNRYYSVHPRRNDRFLGPTPLLRELFGDMDFTEIAFTRHLMTALRHKSARRFEVVVEELQRCWTRHMGALLDRVPGPKILLWLAAHHPEDRPGARAGYRNDPLYIDLPMLEAIAEKVDGRVDVIFAPDPRPGWAEGMIFTEIEMPVARETPGAPVHAAVAEALSARLGGYFPRNIPA
ncbi:MAG: DUF6473 family protein [Tropicimonas sp.]|uniref:DUF6473 family protein n=1 Tax=Tropicimonas sp. TaxID=2067044 RepID=UPI003A83DBC0